MAKRHYVNNKDFYEAIVKYKEKLEHQPDARIPDYIGVCIVRICERLSTKPNFVGYTFRDEMVADGVENCIKSVHLFKIDRTNNPFAYFTQIAWNAFLRRIALEKKEQYLKHKNIQHIYLSGEMADMQHGDSGASFQLKDNDVSNDIITKFEDKLTKNKKKDIILGVDKFVEG
jgi:hypothetical protein